MKRISVAIILVATVLISAAFLVLAANAYAGTINGSKQQSQIRASASKRIDQLTASNTQLQNQLNEVETANAQCGK